MPSPKKPPSETKITMWSVIDSAVGGGWSSTFRVLSVLALLCVTLVALAWLCGAPALDAIRAAVALIPG